MKELLIDTAIVYSSELNSFTTVWSVHDTDDDSLENDRYYSTFDEAFSYAYGRGTITLLCEDIPLTDPPKKCGHTHGHTHGDTRSHTVPEDALDLLISCAVQYALSREAFCARNGKGYLAKGYKELADDILVMKQRFPVGE